MGNSIKPLVSVVILTWNRKDDLRETLDILEKEKYPNLEIIVIDNNSTDGTTEMVAENFSFTNYSKLDSNIGIAGYNIGFKKAAGEYILILDSDSYPHPEAITKMVELFESNKKAGVIAFDIHTPTKLSLSAKLPKDSVTDFAGYHGAGTGLRREVFEKTGYWYEPFFLYFNEMDHAMRVIKNGYRIIHSPSIIAFHKSSPVSRTSDSAPYYYLRNGLWLAWRNFPLLHMIKATCYLLYLSVSETFRQGNLIYLKGVAGAFGSIFKVISSRSALKDSDFKKLRIPYKLIFSRWS